MCLRKPAFKPALAKAGGVFAAVVVLAAGCAGITAAVARFEERAGPAVARGCAEFHKAEASPLVQAAIAAGTIAGPSAPRGAAPGAGFAATGGAAGIAVAAIRGFGERFCANGPPAWIAGVARQLLAEAAKVAAAVR